MPAVNKAQVSECNYDGAITLYLTTITASNVDGESNKIGTHVHDMDGEVRKGVNTILARQFPQWYCVQFNTVVLSIAIMISFYWLNAKTETLKI